MPLFFNKNRNGTSSSASLDINQVQNLTHSINLNAVNNVCSQIAWSKLHRAVILRQYTDIEARSVAMDRVEVKNSVRFDLLGKIGLEINKRLMDSQYSIFGDYILILDNFSVDEGIERGLGNPADNLKQAGYSNEQVTREVSFLKNLEASESVARSKFASIIKELALSNPQIHYLLRPHPVLNPIYWHTVFEGIKNITILCRGSVHSWIYGAKGTIHSGCTTGLEAFGASIPTIDITNLLPQRDISISQSIMSRNIIKVEDIQALNTWILEQWSDKTQANLKIEKNSFLSISELLECNAKEVYINISKNIDVNNAKDIIGQESCLNELFNTARTFISTANDITPLIPVLREHIHNYAPNMGKSRSVSIEEVRRKGSDIAIGINAFGFNIKQVNINQLSTNTFIVS